MLRAKVVLLGPQRMFPTLDRAVASLRVEGRIAAVTAGWEERESEDEELSAHLGGRTVNLRLFERAQDVARRDPELFAATRARNDVLRAIHEIYQLRLGHEMDCARELLRRAGQQEQQAHLELIAAECEASLEAIRQLDAFHLKRLRDVHLEFVERQRPHEREAVVRHRRELAAILGDVGCLCVAGGHVTKLLDHLRLFGLFQILPEMPVIGWSAGSMVLGERVVLFHDHPPQGQGYPEVFEIGIGLHRGVIPLPHASRRLDLDDPLRVQLFARRFRPAQCVVLDPKTRIDWSGRRWHGQAGTQRLGEDGQLVAVDAA